MSDVNKVVDFREVERNKDTPEGFAFILRQIRKIGGMVYHPEWSKVFTVDQRETIMTALVRLRDLSEITSDEFAAYCRGGAKDLSVVWNEKREKWLFSKNESVAQPI